MVDHPLVTPYHKEPWKPGGQPRYETWIISILAKLRKEGKITLVERGVYSLSLIELGHYPKRALSGKGDRTISREFGSENPTKSAPILLGCDILSRTYAAPTNINLGQ